ncbi:MOSC domain-containing protein [Alsobacter sp. R-9]
MTRTIVPARTLEARLVGLMIADGDGFETRPVDAVEVDFEGFVVPGLRGERHRGHARKADARVPWFPRGTLIRNSRQVSIVAVEELAAIAEGLSIPAVDPSWLGANLVVEGLADLTQLPRGTRLFFPDRATIAVEELNVPCPGPGRAIAARHPGRDDIPLGFVKVARRLRGLVGWIERPGTIRAGDAISLRLPEQWIY